jgi:hypothetical protein
MLEVVNVDEIYFIGSLFDDALGGSDCSKWYRYLRYIIYTFILSVRSISVSFKARVILQTNELNIQFCQQVFVLIASTKLHRHLLILSRVGGYA